MGNEKMKRIKEYLKRFTCLRRGVVKCRELRDNCRRKWRMFKAKCNPLQANIDLYIRNHGKAPNLEEPSNFNEKAMWLLHNVYKKDSTVTRCVDKYEMRGYLQEKGLGHLLPEVYGVWDRPEDIDWDSLPDKFAMKCNHGCGCNILCTDKASLDRKDAQKKLRKWLKINFANYYGEVNYKYIKRKIFCEEYLDDGSGEQPVDWKAHCFNGEPKVYMVCTERKTGAKFMFVDTDYNRFPWEIGYHSGGILPPKPEKLDEMTEYARILSEDFPFVRVDFYIIKGKIYVGEMTFSPLGCSIDYIHDEGLQTMGDWLDISKYRKM